MMSATRSAIAAGFAVCAIITALGALARPVVLPAGPPAEQPAPDTLLIGETNGEFFIRANAASLATPAPPLRLGATIQLDAALLKANATPQMETSR